MNNETLIENTNLQSNNSYEPKKSTINESIVQKQIEFANKLGISLIDDEKDYKYLKIDSCNDDLFIIDLDVCFNNINLSRDGQTIIIKPINAETNICFFKYPNQTLWINNDSSLFLTSIIFKAKDDNELAKLENLCRCSSDLNKLSNLIKGEKIKVQKGKSVFLNYLQFKRK